ncbi:MAG TPA: peptide chain release factor N(5)-glutamine methyltransferase [Usitatibacter sp.]|nr:peptide chain release factor N(5)-glutamine methyltransferase [Usitatibacter sp.]
MHTVKAALEELMASIDRIDAQVIMAEVLGVNRAWIAANPMRILTESEDAKIEMLAVQRAMGRPVAYLLNRREFYGRELEVGPDVLIPRPETETLVEAALPRLTPRASCLDLGTGSGAIAVTIACQRPEAQVMATDVSAAALEVAARNAVKHHCAERIVFAQGSWYEPVAGRRFDVIVSNPPYVASADPHLGRGDLRFEPRGALTDGSGDGLDSIRAIVAGAPAHLVPGGWVLFEHGYDQAAAVRGILASGGFTELISLADLAGIPRVAGGKMGTEPRRQP